MSTIIAGRFVTNWAAINCGRENGARARCPAFALRIDDEKWIRAGSRNNHSHSVSGLFLVLARFRGSVWASQALPVVARDDVRFAQIISRCGHAPSPKPRQTKNPRVRTP